MLNGATLLIDLLTVFAMNFFSDELLLFKGWIQERDTLVDIDNVYLLELPDHIIIKND